MRNKWRDLKKETMSASQRKAARKLTDRYLGEIGIRDLRAEMKVTQTELAEKLHKTQTAVSQLESRSDWHLSTLREYVKALGGEVEIRAVFPQRTIRLTHAAQLGRKAARRTWMAHPRTREKS